jgi:hypothetical protein
MPTDLSWLDDWSVDEEGYLYFPIKVPSSIPIGAERLKCPKGE